MHTNTKRVIAIINIIIFIIYFMILACSPNDYNYNDNNIEPEETTWNEPVTTITEITISRTQPVFNEELFYPQVKYEPEPIIEEWIYPLTEEEINLIALLTMGEAEGETELGKRLVIDTVLNRVDDPHFPNNVHDVIYQKYQFSVMWNERINRCYVMPEIVELVKEELLERTNYDCVFFMAGGYIQYGKPMFRECCHYFSSYD